MTTFLHGKAHLEQYLSTDGEQGYHWRNGTTILILTTVGHSTGRQHDTPLIYREHGADYLVVASKGGSPEPPAWFLNLRADSTVQVRIKDDVFTAKARVAGPEEKPDMWRAMVEVWPDYDAYQAKTDRDIAVVVLTRV